MFCTKCTSFSCITKIHLNLSSSSTGCTSKSHYLFICTRPSQWATIFFSFYASLFFDLCMTKFSSLLLFDQRQQINLLFRCTQLQASTTKDCCKFVTSNIMLFKIVSNKVTEQSVICGWISLWSIFLLQNNLLLISLVPKHFKERTWTLFYSTQWQSLTIYFVYYFYMFYTYFYKYF